MAFDRKQWLKDNADRVRASKLKYRLANPEKVLENSKRWRLKNNDRARKRDAKYRIKYAEQRRRQFAVWRKSHREYFIGRNRKDVIALALWYVRQKLKRSNLPVTDKMVAIARQRINGIRSRNAFQLFATIEQLKTHENKTQKANQP